jgi:hypothetical protein
MDMVLDQHTAVLMGASSIKDNVRCGNLTTIFSIFIELITNYISYHALINSSKPQNFFYIWFQIRVNLFHGYQKNYSKNFEKT